MGHPRAWAGSQKEPPDHDHYPRTRFKLGPGDEMAQVELVTTEKLAPQIEGVNKMTINTIKIDGCKLWIRASNYFGGLVLFFIQLLLFSVHRIRRLFSILLLVKLIASQQQAGGLASGQIQYDQDGTERSEDNTLQQQQFTSAFYNEPQPFVYMMNSHGDSGSGDGRASPMSQYGADLSSSSVSPSLITAKCWNNYENDNDCKQINVITASNANDLQAQNQPAVDDDSIITPIVIFESSSTMEPAPEVAAAGAQSPPPLPPAFLAPPYFSSSARPDADNVVLARHRTPPTANDQYAAPPAGATHLPPTSSQGGGAGGAPIRPRPSQVNDNGPATRPSTSVFVATPAPKKPAKTTTQGRKCRDENDEDCDEPETSGRDNDEDEDNNIYNNGGAGYGVSSSEDSKQTSPSDKDDNGGDDDGDSDGDDQGDPDKVASRGRDRGGGGGPNLVTGEVDDKRDETEQGSGSGPTDDNENDDDDEDPEESSGVSEPPNAEQTTRYLEVSPGGRLANFPAENKPSQAPTGPKSATTTTTTKYPNDDERYPTSTMRTSTNGAEIEVVVHPTLPPSFPITTTPASAGGARPTWTTGQTDSQPATPSDGSSPATSPTNMPDDTYTSKPVFPSTSQPSEEPNLGLATGEPGEVGFTTQSGAGGQLGSSATTELDLATFRPVPMPPVEPIIGHRPSDYYNLKDNINSNSTISNSNKDDNGSDGNKLAAKHRFDSSAINTAPPQKFDSPWLREKPPLRSAAGQSSEPWSSSAGRYPRPRTQDQQQQQQQQASDASLAATGGNKAGRVQPEVLPTLLVYASIVIIVVTATIFTLVAFAFWRRNSARHRALLLHKTLNGGPSQHQMVGSMSQASQLVANMQQPGLLSTYAPGKSLAIGKVTTSIIKSPEDNIAEEDEGLADSSPKDSLADGSLNGAMDDGKNQVERQGNSSWSTSDDQTTTTTTTTSSGSRKTNDSPQGAIRGQSGLRQPPNARAVHYSNSLSDERQNSSSMSDSQGSSIDNGPPMGPRKIQHPYSPPHGQAMGYQHQQPMRPPPPPQQQQQPYHVNLYDNGCPPALATQQHYPPPQPHHASGYYNPQAVIPDSVERYNSNRYLDNRQMVVDDQRYLANEQATMQPQPYMTAQNQVMNQQHLIKPPNSNCPPAMAQRQIYPPPSPSSSYSSSTLPRQLMNQQPGPNDAYLINGMPHPRLGNGYMHRNTISMEFSNQFDAHV